MSNTLFKKLIYVLIIALSVITSCKKESSDCSNNKYYLTFIGNGERFCYSNCITFLSQPSVQDEFSVFDSLTLISAGELIKQNDSILYDPKIDVLIFGQKVGLYNNKSIQGLNSWVTVEIHNKYFSYPKLDSTGTRGNFEINIKEYDLEKNLISGTFKGVLYHANYKDSLLISDGEFRGELKFPEN
jgi:hypothetical protein